MFRVPTRTILCVSVPVAIALIWGAPVAASTPIPVTLEELSARADFVVLGRVVDREARFNDEASMILTHTTVEVQEAIIGDPPATLEISEYGGRVGDVGMVVPGLPAFEAAEQVLVFVCRDALNLFRVCGARQGKLLVVTDSAGTVGVRGEMGGRAVGGTLDALRGRIRAASEAGR